MTDIAVTTRTKPGTQQYFLVGVIAAAGIRSLLFLISFGVLTPGVGYSLLEALSWGHGDLVDMALAGILLAAGIYGAAGARSMRYAYRMGVIFVVDNIAYSVGIVLAYRGEDASVVFPIGLIALQIPLVVIAAMLIRRARR